jgi:acetylornithine/succinyldiaminopimelate/putrescine aminotransferase/nucleoside-diphosphate-sugar epimerase
MMSVVSLLGARRVPDPLRPPPVEPFAAAAPDDPLGVLGDARARSHETLTLASRHLDPSFVEVLRIIGFDKSYTHARGSHVYDAAGRGYLDFHTGEGFASLGHNHPAVCEVVRAVLDADLVDGVQIHFSVLAGMLAEALSARLPAGLDAVFFANSGAEAVDSAIKFARACTRRPRLVSCDSAFHGVSLGPLSLVGDDFFTEGFGPLLPGCARVPFGDLDRLERELRGRDVAAFIVEPIQGRAVLAPPPGYLQGAQELCRRYGTLFVLDEVQTGLGRTGRWFALEHCDLEPDFVLVGKALSGGYLPVAAMVTRRELHDRAVGTLERSYVHQSTFGRNRLSMAAGLATLRVIERDGLVDRAARLGQLLLSGLRELQHRHDLIADIRGSGLMIGVELGPPSSRIGRLNWRLLHRASEGLFPQLIVIPLHRDHGVITMASGKNDVIKLLPPLTLSEAEAHTFLDALDAVLTACGGHNGRHWSTVRQIATATLHRRAGREIPQVVSSTADIRPLRPLRNGKPRPVSDNSCLVTGATGFIGSHLAQRLVEEGLPVRCLVRATSDTAQLDELDVELAVGDLTDPVSLTRAAAGCRHVVHCGAMVSDWGTTAEIAAVNVDGTRNLLQAASAAGVTRVIHVSSTDVYGYPGAPGIDESYASTRFANWYAQTKREAETEVRRAQAAHSLETVILRPATVYGPRSVDVVGEIARSIRGRRMILVDGGRAVAGLLYVENLIDAAVLAMRSDAAPGHAFNLSDGLSVTWREFTDGLAAGLGCPPVRLTMPYWLAAGVGFSLESGYRLARRAAHVRTAPLLSRQAVHVLGRNQTFSSRKARDLLGWEPRIGYDAGLEATLAWLRSEHDTAHASDVKPAWAANPN